ncbi:hypothetical protein NUW54_g12215 [Trametes sanguinea]|uniref:Uncharacterized protein n=1 Tax=Trametes sanguinea TaxID=158606 RepID=A0ACC1N220_9APHY|nr:hypothetical protein NUW54_g12215 [Trametes sanguinea]
MSPRRLSNCCVPIAAPGTKERGFAQVVEFLKDWDWTTGIAIPLDNADQTTAAPPTPPATTSRDTAWSMSTPFDPQGHMWTSSGPNAVIARRITALAKATWECLQGMETGASSVKRIFHHPVDHYDFVVELNPALSPRHHQLLDADPSVWASKGKYANALSKDSAAATMPGFDPIAMLYDDLKFVYADTVLLFCDPLGGNRIGAVWQPSLRTPRACLRRHVAVLDDRAEQVLDWPLGSSGHMRSRGNVTLRRGGSRRVIVWGMADVGMAYVREMQHARMPGRTTHLSRAIEIRRLDRGGPGRQRGGDASSRLMCPGNAPVPQYNERTQAGKELRNEARQGRSRKERKTVFRPGSSQPGWAK